MSVEQRTGLDIVDVAQNVGARIGGCSQQQADEHDDRENAADPHSAPETVHCRQHTIGLSTIRTLRSSTQLPERTDGRTDGRLAGFDGLRAVAALSVFGYHVAFFSDRQAFVSTSPSWALGLAQQLRAGVWIFFVLSGLLLYRGWAAHHLDGAEAPRIGAYLQHRVLRVYPAYLVALVFFVGIHRTLLNPQSGLATAFRQFSLTQIYAGVLDTFSGLPHTWSLAVEISFYLCLPLYAAAVGWMGTRLHGERRLLAEGIGVAALVVLWLCFTIVTDGNALRQQWLPNFAMAFACGIALAVMLTDRAAPSRLRSACDAIAGHPVMCVVASVVVLATRSRLGITHENGFASQIFYAAAAVLVVIPVAFQRWEASRTISVLEWAPIRFLGRISYGIFLWHYLLIEVVRVDWLDEANVASNPLKLAIVALVPTLAVATASWYCIERPIARIAQRRRIGFGPGLALLTVGGGLWRVYYVLVNRDRLNINGDAAYYFYQAQAIAKGLGFVDPFQWHFDGVVAESAGHPPTYLLYLAGLIKAGVTSQTGLRLASCLLGAAMVMCIGLAAREVARSMRDGAHADRIGLLAAFAGASYANLWINDEMLMSEGMAALATALCVLTIVRFSNAPSQRRAMAIAGAVGFAAMSRAELLALSVLVIVPLILARRDIAWRDRLRWLAVCTVIVTVIVAPWVGYNLSRFNRPVLMSNGIGGVTLNGNCSGTYSGELIGYWYVGCGTELARLYQHDPEIRRICLLTKANEAFEPGRDLRGDESDREACWRTLGLRYLSDHAGEFPKVALARVARTWEVFRVEQGIALNGGLEGRGFDASRLANRQYYVLMAFTLIGLVTLRRRNVRIWPFLVFGALASFTAITSFGITRYRVPVDVVLPIVAAVGVSTVLSACVRRVDAYGRAQRPTA